jgi:DNA (cytosine-5)-methyltransferase 1
MTAYYNEIDPYAAQWLRNLIDAGHIAPGIVDERSIEDVFPSDLRGFTQCHFFAGIGVWSYALRTAGWGDDRPVWTGSCPCQPFSEAGSGAGFADKRHLWPAWHHLIKECRPAALFGEQVSGKRVEPWIDLVQDDLEAMGYALGALAFPACSIGAENIRDRLYWHANAGQHDFTGKAKTSCHRGAEADGPSNQPGMHREMDGRAWPTEWVKCHDGFQRPIEPGLRAVVDAYPTRVERLRAYGNAINAEAARVWIETVMEAA